ncbi:MAG: acetylglutamate kinase [Candidatus Syntrophoarchaeum sp.]|nr:acetylglutamate kinase [Methanosarcinales archaeon]MCW7077146.1 acetylglutamate kinase [Candidatus Syntrophoarchaeum sp.]
MSQRAKILIEALPYIQEFADSIMVIKIGGNAIVEPAILDDIVRDVILLQHIGIHPVVIHGGGPEISEKMERLGKKPEFAGGLRITDDETLEITRMVLVGNVNTRIVSLIGKYGGKGIGLSGKDGKLILARKKAPVTVDGALNAIDLGWVGETEIINPEIVMITSEQGYIPVIAPIAVDLAGNSLNLNADTVSGDIAAALHAKKLILLTDVPGVLLDKSDERTRISHIALSEVDGLIEKGVINGGMIPKVHAGVSAIKGGALKVHIIDGSKPHSLLLELLTDEGIGTMMD